MKASQFVHVVVVGVGTVALSLALGKNVSAGDLVTLALFFLMATLVLPVLAGWLLEV